MALDVLNKRSLLQKFPDMGNSMTLKQFYKWGILPGEFYDKIWYESRNALGKMKNIGKYNSFLNDWPALSAKIEMGGSEL